MYKHILIPVALDHEHTPDEALAVAAALMDDGGKITALHVNEPLPGFAAQYLPEDHVQTRAENLVTRMKAELKEDARVSTEVIEGHAGRSIVDFADSHGVDLIVIASHRPGLQDFFLGSTAARVVRHAQCCVHVLR
ncbi:universal stress protein [Psychromarinibacter sp. S121]|uniref:universal stress protein n=1 Tax=Psychromarinibacter sp. S121 TaxID=3415127 RepID=UPI003C7E1F49